MASFYLGLPAALFSELLAGRCESADTNFPQLQHTHSSILGSQIQTLFKYLAQIWENWGAANITPDDGRWSRW